MTRFRRDNSASRLILLASALMVLAGCEARYEDEEAKPKFASPCEPMMFEQSRFTVCTAQPGKHTIATDLAPADSDIPFRSLAAFDDAIGKRADRVAMAMNGGMFDADGQPIGYYVEDGRRHTVLNESDGPGNFHLLPNGVFFGGAEGPWRVLETQAFAAQASDRPDFATQSGPMLVVNGELHPRIRSNGESRKIRNGVGVDASGRALFLISEVPVSFGKMARFYRDVLNAENALFLDGTVSQIWDPANGRMDAGYELGPLIVIENRAEARK